MSTVLASPTPIGLAVAALRAADPAAFAVAPRVLRRVIRHELEIRGFARRVPHRLSFVIAREKLHGLVAADELSLEDLAQLPETVILLAHPEDADLEPMTYAEIAGRFRRLLFHAQLHVALDELRQTGRLRESTIRRRIDELGQAEFDEARAVLRQEHLVTPEATPADSYVELVAVWFEMRSCRPHLVPIWFPSLRDPAAVDGVLGQDLDLEGLWDSSRSLGECPPQEPDDIPDDQPANDEPLEPSRLQRTFARTLFRRRLRKARAAEQKGNDVRAAVLYKRAAILAPRSDVRAIDERVAHVVVRLARRLQAALEFEDTDEGTWREVLAGLAASSDRGFWNADVRLLYDLQKVCLDHERAVSAVDLVGWAFTLGRRPFKRPLPNQREVLMSKHLHSAARRTPHVRLPGALREKLAALLDAAAYSAEHQMRRRLRPLVGEALTQVGLAPDNVPERVAFRKIVERLLDAVVRHGYFNMGDLRDSISRNNLKLNDLGGPRELLSGDELLRADRALGHSLDGVYRRGEVYIRALQRLSAAAFGTKVGRFLVKYLAIPFGGAFVILKGALHLVNLVAGFLIEAPPGPPGPSAHSHPHALIRESHRLDLAGSALLGLLLLLLIHVPSFRRMTASALRGAYRIVKGTLVDLPQWVLKLEPVRTLLRHPLVVTLRRWIVQPGLFTGLIWLAAPLAGFAERPGWIGATAIFAIAWLILNSRTGRDIEELATEQVERLWHRIRIHVFVALFDLVMESFKRVLDFIEKLLYEVDEFLRFRSGDSPVALGAKAVLGIAWSVVTFVVRFCVTLLIEPQINPIKHFPVVTVSHKVLLPFIPVLAGALANFTDKITASAIATAIITAIPGVFGFLVWELRENWRLYAANRVPELFPVIVGEHGETAARLLRPGFHSGTVPRYFTHRRRAAHSDEPARRRSGELKFQQRLRQLQTSVRRFVTRELIALLEESGTIPARSVTVGTIRVGINSLHFELQREGSDDAAWLALVEQSGSIVADVTEPGWIATLPWHERERVSAALVGFLRMGAANLVRAQIEACLPSPRPPYDVSERGLVVWPDRAFETEVSYNLAERPRIRPRPRNVADAWSMPTLDAGALVFDALPCPWSDWVAVWSDDVATGGSPAWRTPVVRA